MKKTALAIIVCSLAFGCSQYKVRTELSDPAAIKSFASAGVIFRMPGSNQFTHSEMENNFEAWIAPSAKKKNVVVVKNVDVSIGIIESDLDRFYQLSDKNTYQKYKSIGVITLFLRNNEQAIKKIFADNQLDSLLIYEVEAGSSSTMQIMTFNSNVVVVDSQMKICFMDHQKNTYDINEWYPDTIKKHLMDKISDRLMQFLVRNDYVEIKK